MMYTMKRFALVLIIACIMATFLTTPVILYAENSSYAYTAAEAENEEDSRLVNWAITIIAPIAIAFIVCSFWYSEMKTAQIATSARDYVVPGSFNLTKQEDSFLYRTTSRVKIEKKQEAKSNSS